MFRYLTILIFSFYLQRLKSQSSSYTSDLIASTNSQNTTLGNIGNNIYTTTIGIGSPAQQLTVQVDTGSNALWVAYQTCPLCGMTNRFNPTNQTNFVLTGVQYYQEYGIGTASGLWGFEQVQIDESEVDQYFQFVFVTSEFDFADPTGYSGIMGLSNLATYTNLFQTSYSNGQISSPLYGLALQPHPFNSYLLYGNIDSQIINNASWIQTVNTQRWLLKVESVSFNGVSENIGLQNTALIDSGTSCLVLSEIEKDLYSTLRDNYLSNVCTYNSNEESWFCPCQPTSAQQQYLPTIQIDFQSVIVEIPFQNYVPDVYIKSSGNCEACISSTSGFMIFGDVFFRSAILLFNKQENLVGILTP